MFRFRFHEKRTFCKHHLTQVKCCTGKCGKCKYKCLHIDSKPLDDNNTFSLHCVTCLLEWHNKWRLCCTKAIWFNQIQSRNWFLQLNWAGSLLSLDIHFSLRITAHINTHSSHSKKALSFGLCVSVCVSRTSLEPWSKLILWLFKFAQFLRGPCGNLFRFVSLGPPALL